MRQIHSVPCGVAAEDGVGGRERHRIGVPFLAGPTEAEAVEVIGEAGHVGLALLLATAVMME